MLHRYHRGGLKEQRRHEIRHVELARVVQAGVRRHPVHVAHRQPVLLEREHGHVSRSLFGVIGLLFTFFFRATFTTITTYSMLNTIEDSVNRVSIEYNGLGSQPYFVINVEGEVKFIPIKRGVTRLTDIIDK